VVTANASSDSEKKDNNEKTRRRVRHTWSSMDVDSSSHIQSYFQKHSFVKLFPKLLNAMKVPMKFTHSHTLNKADTRTNTFFPSKTLFRFHFNIFVFQVHYSLALFCQLQRAQYGINGYCADTNDGLDPRFLSSKFFLSSIISLIALFTFSQLSTLDREIREV
jgi:hypothetical protein